MKKSDFKNIEGYEKVLDILVTGKCKGIKCRDCPFSEENLTKPFNCVINGYTSLNLSRDEEDEQLIKSAYKFKEMLRSERSNKLLSESEITSFINKSIDNRINKEIKYIVDKPYVYAYGFGTTGVATCREDDEFDETFGKELAKARLLKDKDKIDKLLREYLYTNVRFDTTLNILLENEDFIADCDNYSLIWIDNILCRVENGKVLDFVIERDVTDKFNIYKGDI